ncbi:Zinc (Zn2+)-Iron (Fe2+) Permease (ZIP) Family, partial [Pseudoloma neurophilia]
DHSHHDHSHHDHKHEFSFFMKNLGFFMAGLSFIFLLGIDSLLLQHSHCNNEEIVYMNDGINHGAHQHQYCHVHEEMHSSSSIGDMHPNHHSDGSIVIEKSAEIQTSQPCSAPLKKNNEEVTIDENNSNEKDQKKETKIHFHSEQKETFYLEGGCNTSALKDQKGRLQAMIFIIALSIHSLFEGFAIKSTDIGIFEIGLILHKALESFALGFTVCMANFSTQFKLILMTTYSLLTPLGMFISFLLQKLPIAKKSAKIGHIFQSTCNGLALGSILFIVCVEMIPPNFHSKGANLYKIFTLIAGYLSTCIIIYFIH